MYIICIYVYLYISIIYFIYYIICDTYDLTSLNKTMLTCCLGWCTPLKTNMEHPKISGLYRCFSFSKGVCSGFMLFFWLCMLLYAGVSLHIRETVFIHLTSRKFDARPTQTESTFIFFCLTANIIHV